MKVCFVQGTKFKEDKEGNLYTGGSYSEEIWKRYQEAFGQLTVLARLDEIKRTKEDYLKLYNIFNTKDKKFIELPNLNSIANLANNYFKVKKIIKDTVKENDILIARLPSMYSYIACHYAIKFKKKYIVEVVGCPWDSLWNYNYKGKILAFYSFIKMRRIVKKANNVIYVTNEFLQKRYPNKGYNIGCSDVSIDRSDDYILTRRIEKIRKVEQKQEIIFGTCAGIDVKHKGQEYVIKAMSLLKDKGFKNIEYQMVGDGDSTRLINIAKKYGVVDNLKFMGSMPHNEVFKWLDTVDIYIQPSNTEGLCRALLEAMSRGCPCIASNAGGNPELICPEYVFKKKNVFNLFETILDLISNKENLENNSRYCFEKSKLYDKDILETKRKTFFENVKLDKRG